MKKVKVRYTEDLDSVGQVKKCDRNTYKFPSYGIIPLKRTCFFLRRRQVFRIWLIQFLTFWYTHLPIEHRCLIWRLFTEKKLQAFYSFTESTFCLFHSGQSQSVTQQPYRLATTVQLIHLTHPISTHTTDSSLGFKISPRMKSFLKN